MVLHPTDLVQVSAHTQHLCENLGSHRAAKVAVVLAYMNNLGLNLFFFLNLVSWNDLDCITHLKIHYEHSTLMVSEELPLNITQWHQLPQSTNSMHVQAHGAISVLECFAFTYHIGDVIGGELEGIRHVLQCPPEDLSMEELCTLFIEDPILKLSTPGFGGTPQFWSLLLSRDWHRYTYP